MKVYFISGLAADSRVFKHIHLPAGYETIHLEWITATKNESLESYAGRLAVKIDSSKPFILIGLSMGGMVASEIAKIYKPVATILLSSAATYKQFPFRFKIAYHLKLYRFIPGQFFKSVSLIKRLFTTDSGEHKKILEQVIKDSDPAFIRWALEAILKWRNETIPYPMWHIHGSKDEILPMRYTKPTHIIKKGTHLMVMSRAEELNKLIEEIFTTLEKEKK